MDFKSEYVTNVRVGLVEQQRNTLASQLTAAQARIEKLTAALGRFTLSCENIHHKRGEYHNSDEPCKALAAVKKAMGE